MRAYVRACLCALARVALLIQRATRIRDIVICRLSGSAKVFDIMS
jgi:hypothetical protein